MKSYLIIQLSLFCLFTSLHSQVIPATSGSDRGQKDQRLIMSEQSYFTNTPAHNIGPTVFNGRVVDLDVNPDDPTEFFVAYASGGLWYTHNNGTTFEPLFQQETVMTIGDIAVDWKKNIIYLGSGEPNSSRSSYAGNGVYKSNDKGKNWQHLGLVETHHIGKVIIHPENSDIVWVAALGHLYSENPQRGIYKSSDGGQSWQQTLYLQANAGAVDIVMHPENPQILYASIWEKSRTAWNFVESGPASGIFKSIDGGQSWLKISSADNGFIDGQGTGRIGLDIATKDGQTYLYAIVDNNNRRPKDPKEVEREGLTKEDFKSMSKEDFLKIKAEDLKKYLADNGFPKKYTESSVTKMVKEDKIKVSDLGTFNEDANSLLFDTPVVGAEVYLSKDDGASWQKTHEGYLDDLYYSYGYYFGKIHVSPADPAKVYIYGVPILRSDDYGKNWKNINGDNQHVDHHSLWINPNKKGHLINGNDGGVNISYDDGESWIKCIHPAVGQFYYINVDYAEPYNVYGGTQDNGVWVGSHTYKPGTGWQMDGEYPYKSIMGGDGMQVQIDNRDNATIYTGFQFGNYFRINNNKKEFKGITPKHDLGSTPYRWNWQTPILLSTFNQDILYMGANKLLRSMNQGNDFVEISPDLTKGGKKGNVPFGTITTIHESPLKFGLIYVGTDDGLVHVTKDGGVNWAKISDELPQDFWVSRVQASTFDEATVYVTLNGYRNDHFMPYVYSSSDYGKSWKNISSNLPNEPVNVIKEDPRDADILYVGTDHGSYVSFNKGAEWMSLGANDLPNVAVHDMVVQAKAEHLLIGTHGRSIYKMEIKHLPMIKSKPGDSLMVFEIPEVRHNPNWGRIRNVYTEANTPKIAFSVFSNRDTKAMLELKTTDGKTLKKEEIELKKGLAVYELIPEIQEQYRMIPVKAKKKGDPTSMLVIENLTKADDGKYYLPAGKYKVVITDKKSVETMLNIVVRNR